MRTCTIWGRPKLSEINESLVSSVAYRDFAGGYGTSKSAAAMTASRELVRILELLAKILSEVQDRGGVSEISLRKRN